MTDADTNKTQLFELIDGIEIAMFTTRRPDGRLVSRPMATQARAAGADLWFVTDASAYKLDELEQEPQVNLAYYNQQSREYVSVSGTARHGTARHGCPTTGRRSPSCIAPIGRRGSRAIPRTPEHPTIRVSC